MTAYALAATCPASWRSATTASPSTRGSHSVSRSLPRMSPHVQKLDLIPRRPRYLIHLFCAHDESNDACPTSPAYNPGLPASGSVPALASVVFTDECELIETINPLVVPTSETFSATSRAPRALFISSISAPGKRRIGWRG
jgi:hypothetical protein